MPEPIQEAAPSTAPSEPTPEDPTPEPTSEPTSEPTPEPIQDPTSGPGLQGRILALRAQYGALSKALDKAGRALDALLNRAQPWSTQSVTQALKGFNEPEALAEVQLDAGWRGLVGDLLTYCDRQALHLRQHLLTSLRDTATAQSIRFEKLTDSPTVIGLQPFNIEVDWENHKATFSFAREVIEEVPLDVGAILKAHAHIKASMKDHAVPSERFFHWLRLAWQLTLSAKGDANPDDRADIVDLLGPLALLSSPPETWRNLRERAMKPYPRYLLAYQLFRLRKDRCLELDGWRVDIGAATGGATKKKQNVLFIPTSPNDGQYYLSIRFLPTRGDAETRREGEGEG